VNKTIEHEKHAASKIKRTYLFVIGVLLWEIAYQLIFHFLYLPQTSLVKLTIDFREVFILGIPILLFFFITKAKLRDVFQFHKVSFKNIAYVVLLTLLFIPLAGTISVVSRLIFPNPVLLSHDKTYTTAALWFMFISLALQPALLEELTFRGIVRDGFSDYPLKRQALLVGICFGLFHLNFDQFFYTAVFGFLMVYILYYTRSIIATMLFHFLNNGASTLASYLSRAHLTSSASAVATTMSTTPISVVIAGLIILAFFFAFTGTIFWLAYRSFVRYNKIRLGMIDPVAPSSVMAPGSDPAVVVQSSVPVYAQYAPAEVQATIRVAAPAASPPPAVQSSIPVYAQYAPAGMQAKVLVAAPAVEVDPPSAQPAVSEQHGATAALPEGSEPLPTPATTPTEGPRLFTPLFIVVLVIGLGFATFVQIYDTLIIR